MKTFARFLQLLVLASVVASAQEVSIPDPGLNTAIRDALQKPSGPLTTQDLLSLTNLAAGGKSVRSLEGLGAAQNLTTLDLIDNQLPSLTLPAGLTSLTTLRLGGNQLTNLALPADLTSLSALYLQGNRLSSLTLPAGLTSLTTLYLGNNQLTSLTLPAELMRLTTLELAGNPLKIFVLPEPLAVASLKDRVALLRSQGVSVYTYALALSLVSPQRTQEGPFACSLTGPPAVYTINGSTDLSAWSELGTITNTLGTAVFTDSGAANSPRMFYRAVLR